jgi:hypothetical protein
LDLAGFQQQLSDHYSRLRDLRASENYPVYAIEHGLTAEEVSTALSQLSQNFQANARADGAYYLVWTAAAAEVGYRYDGTEYWDSFREAVPKWLDRNRDRDKIREFYRKFSMTYRGLTPAGLWAKQFPIIAWPITQAILPRYLQRHFASYLFELRHLLVKGGELTLDEIGDLLSDSYVGRSSLFEGFLQQKPLTSRFVMALGMEELADAVAPIEKMMLDRIVADIDTLGSVGRRLREAQRVLRDARFINSYRPGFVPKAKPQVPSKGPAADRAEGPRLVARPNNAETWALSLSIPDLSSPLKSAGITARELEQTRMRFRSCSVTSGWIPARALFAYSGEAEEALDSYPVETFNAFTFDRPIEAVTKALEGRLRFTTREVRLLKIRDDGSAFELSGCYVRANQSYVIVTAATLPEAFIAGLGLTPLIANAPPAHLWRFDVPATLDAPKIAALASLGLGYRLGIRLVPVGLSPRWNSANDGVTFLDTECPVFCISPEITVREFVVRLDQSTPLRFAPSNNGNTLISLGALSVGSHHFSVSALGVATGEDIASEVISIDVRASTPWQSSVAGKAGVALKVDPLEAAFDQFLDGAARLRVVAPPRRSLKLNARFYGLNSEMFRDETLGRYVTPVDGEKLSEIVSQKLGTESQMANVERAARIELAISLDEFGSGRVSFEKPVEPIRWLRLDERKVRLSDDTGEDTPPVVETFDLESVDAATGVEYAQAIEGFELRGKGGLLVATYKGRPYEAVATATQRNFAAFNDLGMPAKLSGASLEPRQIIKALKRWNGARRLMGPMALLARRNAVKVLERALCVALCGDEWVASVERVSSGKQQAGELYSRIWHSLGFASGLAKFAWRYEAEEPEAVAEFVRLVEVYKLPADRIQCALALKLAFSPHTIKSVELPTDEILAALRSERGLLRGAYFARMAADLRGIKTEVA